MNEKTYKQQLLDQLYAPYKNCKACPLGSLGRTHVVFGEGNPNTKLLFIGEAPGREEDLQGRPFVGRSGKLLTKILTSLDVERSEVYISNIVKCRPPNNRKPTLLESTTCKKLLLLNQIKIIRPKIICTLGASAIQGLIDDEYLKITKIRGTIMKFKGIDVIPTYHPAYVLRNPKMLPVLVEDISLAIQKSQS